VKLTLGGSMGLGYVFKLLLSKKIVKLLLIQQPLKLAKNIFEILGILDKKI
jgi:hypothetical protein